MDTHFIDTSLLLTVCFVSGERKPLQISKFNLLNMDTPLVRTLPSVGNLLKPLPTCSGIAGTLKIFLKDINYQWITQNTTLNKPIAFSHLICLGLIDNIFPIYYYIVSPFPYRQTIYSNVK